MFIVELAISSCLLANIQRYSHLFPCVLPYPNTELTHSGLSDNIYWIYGNKICINNLEWENIKIDLNFLKEIELKDLNLGVICIDVAPVRKDTNFWEKVYREM